MDRRRFLHGTGLAAAGTAAAASGFPAPAIAQDVGNLNKAEVLKLFQTRADVRARYGQDFDDLVGAQRIRP